MKFLKEIIPYIIIIIVVVIVRSFVITPVKVSGQSMDPTLKNGEILLLSKINDNYKRFDIVVIKFGNEKIIKRVIGLPNERVSYKDNKLYINGKYVEEKFLHSKTNDFSVSDINERSLKKIPDNYYLVLGDNRLNSYDSRDIGLIKKENIEGIANTRILPLNKIGKI